MIDPATLPERVRTREQWICWEEESDGKRVPLNPETETFALVSQDETWCDLETALECLEANPTTVDGLGFVLRKSDPFVGVVLEDCRDPATGELTDQAKTICSRLDSYTDVSPSGTGVHILLTGVLPEGRTRGNGVELHDQEWVLPVTAERVPGTSQQVEFRQTDLNAICLAYVRGIEDEVHEDPPRVPLPPSVSPPGLSDDAVIDLARNASNGTTFERLWNGSTVGYSSQAAADMALCQLLAYWTGGHAVQMDRLFRRSALLRPHWGHIQYADGSTYGERTIERALATTTEFYEPPTQTCDVCGESGHTPQDREFSYLKEKFRLLESERLEIGAELEQARERIGVLERRLERLEGRPPIDEPDTQ